MGDPRIEFRPIDRAQHELLIVDDDPASRYATARQLSAAGFKTREAATGAEGLRLADDGVSAMILDVHLPDIDGFELCRLLRSNPQTSRLPVLHLTAAYVKDEDKVRGLDSGADAYLTHPVEPAVLIATVQALVRTRVAEDAMRRSEAKFKAIYTHAPGGICLLDEAGCFLDANPALLNFLQRPLEAIIGRPVADFVPPDFVDLVTTITSGDESGLTRHEFPLVNTCGNHIGLEWQISPHVEPGVKMAVATDISQLALLEQQRKQALDREREARNAAEHLSRMKDEFIAVLSHELRSPLNAILVWTHILQQRGANEELMRGLTAIEKNGKMQARLISDLLDMSSMNLGKLHLEFADIDPVEVVSAAINDMQPSAQEAGILLVLDADAASPTVRADAARVQQVVWNLLSNAIKFSPRGKTVTVRVTAEGAGISIAVRDEGQGIAPEFVPRLFDRFTQANASSNRHTGGLGLGLSIVRQLVEAHGGNVTAFSGGLGAGATISIWLPTHAQASEPQEPEHVSDFDRLQGEMDLESATLSGLHLVVVDDDPEACTMLQIILSDRGATVTCAYDVDGALRALDEANADALISDVGMPGKDGYSLVRELRRREAAAPTGTRRLPAIALTAFAQPDDQKHALEAGFDAHCPKPLRPVQLVLLLERLTGRRNSQH